MSKCRRRILERSQNRNRNALSSTKKYASEQKASLGARQKPYHISNKEKKISSSVCTIYVRVLLNGNNRPTRYAAARLVLGPAD